MKSPRPSILLPLSLGVAFSATVASGLLQTQPPRFRAEVAAVLVDVLVLDAQDQPVGGLTGEDFQVYEDGVLQQVESFDVVDWTSYVAQEAPRTGERPPTPPGPSVNTFPRRFIFVINRQGAEFGYLVRAKRALESFVVESMADGDEAMVIDMGMSTKVLQEFRASKEETLRAVRKITPMKADLFYGTEIGTRNVYDTLESLGQALRAFPGRKIVVFLSPELNRNRDLIPYIRDTVNALNQSNTTVYSIDIEGTGGVSADDESEDFALASLQGEDETTSSLDDIDFGGLFPLANETGGRYYYNLNTFEPAVRRIGEENRRYYIMSYTPSNAELDGKYRRIEVRVSRPELKVVARRGYFAGKEKKPQVAESAEKEPKEKPSPARETAPPRPASPTKPGTEPSVRPPQPPPQVEITSYLFPGEEGKVEVPIAVALPVDLLSSGKGRSSPLELKLMLTDASGATVETFSDRVDPARFSLVRSPRLAPGSYLLRISLEDSEKPVYQASTQIDVPERFGARFGVSSIVPVIPPSSTNSTGNATIRPTTTLGVGEDIFIHFRVFPGEEEPSESARVNYAFYQDDQQLRSLDQPNPVALSEAGKAGSPVIARLPTSQLPPGRYRIVVTVSDPKLGRRATGEIAVSVR